MKRYIICKIGASSKTVRSGRSEYHPQLPALRYAGEGWPTLYIRAMKTNLDKKAKTLTELPEEDSYDPVFLMERPLLYQGNVYFLNDKGIFTLENNVPKRVIREQDIDFTGLDHTVYIVDFDYDGQYFYISDFTSRTIYRLKAGN